MAVFQYAYRMVCMVLWKSWRTRRHHFWRTMLEILFPVILVLLLVSVKAVMEPDADNSETNKPTLYTSFDMKGLIAQLCQIGCTVGGTTYVLAYAPNKTFINELMTTVGHTLVENGAKLEIQGFSTESEIEALNALLKQNTTGYFNRPSSLTGAVIFSANPSRQTDLIYKIRLMTSKFITGKIFADVETPGPGKQFQEYESSGFLGLQMAIDRAFITKAVGGDGGLPYSIETQALPYPPYAFQNKSHYTMVLARLLPSAIILGFSYLACITITEIVTEKASGVKQLMTMLGLSNTGYWFGWMLNVLTVAVLSVILIVTILSANVSGEGAVLMYSSISVIWAFLLLYVFAAVWFCFFVTALFYSSAYAKTMAVLVWLGTFLIPALLVGTKQRYLATQLLVSVLPNMCLYWGFNIIASWESRGIGVNWNNLEEYGSTSDSLNLAVLLSMLVFDGLFYMILTTMMRQSDKHRRKLKNPYKLMYDVLYDDTHFPELVRFISKPKGCSCRKRHLEVRERDPGADQPLDSPVGILRSKVLNSLGLLHSEELQRSPSTVSDAIEEQSPMKDRGAQIKNLSKSFQAEQVLRSITCDFYQNEIACICGENGSGKTTLIQILLGILKADEGTAYVNHYDIHDYLTEVRRSIGLCPQKNMLFNDLTVMEHLLLFSWLKGKEWCEAKAQARQLIAMLKLKDKTKVTAGLLSPTDSRKLCFGIAITGDPKVILLDEATSGMDSESMKTAWNILMKIKENKTIVLTTSNLEEADMVADRIAIMNEGHLRCYGSPQYLKNVFGAGYTMKLSVSIAGAEKLVRMISQEIKYADIKNRTMSVGGELITLVVPDVYAPLFPKMFYQLFDHKDEFGIFSVDIHTTSVEEIFFSVREMREFQTPKAMTTSSKSKPAHITDTSGSEFFTGRKISGCSLGVSRLRALMKKNYWMTRSSLFALVFQILIPLALVLSGITGANRGLRNRDTERYSQINIRLNGYQNPVSLFTIQNQVLKTAYMQAVGNSAKATDYKGNLSEAVLEVGKKDEAAYRHQYIVGAEQNNSTITALYSTVPYNSPPLALNMVSNALLKAVLPKTRININVENHPMQNGSEEALQSVGGEGASTLVRSFCFYFAYALAIICAMVAIKPMKERVSGSHHLQMMTSISPFTFWSSYLIVDGAFVLLFATIALLITFICQEGYIYTMNGGAVALFVILFVGGLASISFAYFFSQTVNNSAAAFGWLNILHLLAALGSYVVYQTHDGISDSLSQLFYWATTPFPIPFVVHALFTYSKLVIKNGRCEVISEHALNAVCDKQGLFVYLPAYSCCENCTGNDCFSPESFLFTSHGIEGYTIVRDLIILSLAALTYFIVVILMDLNYFQKVNQCFLSAPSELFTRSNEKGGKDPSTAQEAEWVRKLVGLGEKISEQEGLLVDGLCKNYGTIGAYCNVSFSVKKGECFGLLGLSGSGKTSVFKTLAGEQLPAVGDAYMSPYSMLGNPREFTSSIGYCPQKNSILKDLSGREMLMLFGSLKGIYKPDLMTEVNQWLSALGLENDADRKSGGYSKGMKRRLCVAIALIGNPEAIILDEPSREIDPSGRKHLWNTLQRLQRNGKIILLASNNVQECENLCSRIGLMINGRLQYVGTTREIKNKFLNGFTVAFRLKKRFAIDTEEDLDLVGDIKLNIENILEDGVFREAHHNTLKYLIPQKGQNWGSIVEKLEKIRTSMSDSIDYYSMTESTLDEVFTAMAELDSETTNELPGVKVTNLQRCLMGQCCSDDYS